ncbi:MAG: DUF72 domain-containing protein [Dehalococcoidia bacterium]|nr:DUF72 domain-containing protein [Dehalococcoidia bacterium]
MASVFLGTSGWHYKHWRERYYPVKLTASRWLSFYAQTFSTVEVNNSFYHLPAEKDLMGWKKATYPGFIFAVKASRLITHMKKLHNIDQPLENFLSRIRILGERLGPVLYQLPPNLHKNADLVEDFCSRLPEDLRHVLEFRHASWFDPAIFAIMERRNIGFCIFDAPGQVCPEVVTSDFVYIRFHGSSGIYSSCYTDRELDIWAERVRRLSQGGRAVYAYFNNDAGAHAVHNALGLRKRLEGLGEIERT